jgi:RHS repeat-associated protein
MISTNLMNNLNYEHVQVDPRSGQAAGRISIARLVANNRVGPTFDLDFVHRGAGSGWQLAMTRIRKVANPARVQFEITLASGATFMMHGTRMASAAFVVSIDRLGAVIYHRDGTVETFKEVGPEPCFDSAETDFKFVPDKHKAMRDAYVKGGVESTDSLYYVLESISTPLGHSIKFEWRIWHEDRRVALPGRRESHYRLYSIKDDGRTLLAFDEDEPNWPRYFTLFPGSAEHEVKYHLSFFDTADPDAKPLDLYRYGDGKRTKTTLKPGNFSNRLASISVAGTSNRHFRREMQYHDGALLSIRSYVSGTLAATEMLSYSDGKVVECRRHNDVGLKTLTTRYSYAESDGGRVFTAEADDAGETRVVKYFDAAGRQAKEETTVYGVTRVVAQNISFDDKSGRTLGNTVLSLKGLPDSEVTVKWEMDSEGNLLKLEKDNLVTEYTYCTTMHHIKQTFEELKDSNNDFWSYLLYPVDELLWTAGIDSGLTWAKEEKRALTKESAGYSPGKEIYNLPVALCYPGERCGFDRFVESEVIYRNDGKPGSAIQAKFYSYKALNPKQKFGAESLTNGEIPVVEKVLTVLAPDLMRFDSFSARKAALIESGGDFLRWANDIFEPGPKMSDHIGGLDVGSILGNMEDHLFQKAFIGLVDPDEVRKDNLEFLAPILSEKLERDYNLLIQMAKRNSVRWRLKSHKGPMTVETIEYSTAQADYGLPSRIQVHLVDKSGVKIKGSNVDTIIKREYRDGKFLLRTDVTSELGARTAATTGYSSFTGDVLSEDTPFGAIQHDYKDQGCTIDTSVFKLVSGPGPTQAELASTSKSSHFFSLDAFHVETSDADRKTSRRTVFDALGRQTEEQMIRGGDVRVLSTTKYDEYGRLMEQVAFDYLANGDALTEHSVTSSYDAKGNRTVVRTLRDGSGEPIDTVTDVYSTTPAGLTTLKRGASIFHRQYDAAKHTVSEWEEKAFPYLRTLTTRSAEGWVKKIEYFNVTAKGEEALLAHRTLEHDAAGRCTKASRTGSQDTSWQYDVFGRMTQLTSGDVTVRNVYPDHTAAAVATEASLSEGTSTVVLGAQKCDGFGRVSALQPKGLAETRLSYPDGSMSWGRDSSISDPEGLFHTLAGSSSVPRPMTQHDVDMMRDKLQQSQADRGMLGLESLITPSTPERPAKPESPAEPESLVSSNTTFSSTLDLASLTYCESCEGRTSESTYSLQGSLVQFKDIAGNTTGLTYDLHGRISRISTVDKAETVFEYDVEGRLLKETVRDLSTGKEIVITFAYDLMGHEIKRTFICDGFDELSIDRALLSDGRLKKSTLNAKGVERRSDNYEYQACGRLAAWSCTDKEALTSSGGAGCTWQKFTYDALGNVVEIKADSPAGDTTRSFAFSEKIPGMLSENTDDRGRDIVCGNYKISYHPNGQVNAYDNPSANTSYRFQYDNFGCIRGTVRGQCWESYHYRGNRLYARQQVDRVGSTSYGYHSRTIIVLNESSSCLLQQIHTKAGLASEAAITTSFELRDAAGSIFASYDLSTNTVSYFSYTPYGHRGFKHDMVTWLGFKGEPLNALGLYHPGNGYRLYDPQQCRFQSPDSWSPFGRGGANRYGYCGGDPVNYRDPSGHRIEVWSEKRRLEDPLLNDPLNVVGMVASLVSIALAPFSCGGGLGLRIAAGLITTALSGVSAVSMFIQKAHPELSLLLDGLAIVSGRNIGNALARAGRNARLARSPLTAKSAAASTRNMNALGSIGDAIDVLDTGLLANGLYGLLSSGESVEGSDIAADSGAAFFAENTMERAYALPSSRDLPLIPVDQFLASCTPLQDAIGQGWATEGKIDVANVLKAYMLAAGTLTMENRGPLAAGNKLFNDLAMYGVHYTEPDGMFCRGNAPASLAELHTGLKPFS